MAGTPKSPDDGRNQGAEVDDAATLADREDQGVGGHEGERAGVGQGAGADSSTRTSRSRAITETCDFDSPVTARNWTSLSIRRADTPNR